MGALLVLALSGTAWAQDKLELTPVREIVDGAILATFSPDGKHVLAALRNGSIAVYDAESGKEILSAAASPAMEDLMDSYLRPECFSPDGARILVTSRMPERAPDQWGGALQLLLEAGKKPVEIRGERSSSWFGVWSADGKHVYFIDGGHRKEMGYSILRWAADTGKTEKLHENKERLACGLRRSPDGTKLAFCDFLGKDQDVRVVVLDLNGGKLVESEPFWVDDAGADGIRVIHWEQDGKSILFNGSPNSARDPGTRERYEVRVFEPAARRSAPLIEGKTLDAVFFAPAGKDRFFAASRAKGMPSYCVINRKGEPTELPAGLIGIAAAGDKWLTIEGRSGKLSIMQALWILK